AVGELLLELQVGAVAGRGVRKGDVMEARGQVEQLRGIGNQRSVPAGALGDAARDAGEGGFEAAGGCERSERGGGTQESATGEHGTRRLSRASGPHQSSPASREFHIEVRARTGSASVKAGFPLSSRRRDVRRTARRPRGSGRGGVATQSCSTGVSDEGCASADAGFVSSGWRMPPPRCAVHAVWKIASRPSTRIAIAK